MDTKELKTACKTLATLGSVTSVLHWDQETYMPSGSIEFRSEQLALMSSLTHQRQTSPEFEQLLAQFIDLKTGQANTVLSKTDQKWVQGVHRDWKMAKALPDAFVQNWAKTSAQSQHTWQAARVKNDFSLFAPLLEKMIGLAKEKASYLNTASTAYDTLLDEFEPGMTAAELTPVFARLRDGIVTLLKTLQERPETQIPWAHTSFDPDQQWAFGLRVLTDMGYRFEHGRQDKSAHPFTIHFHPHDVRITTRISPTDFLDGLSSTIHEGGHALYEQGVNPDWFGTPIGTTNSLGVHESQSRLWENIVGKSLAFWTHYYPVLQTHFPNIFQQVSLPQFYKALHKVKPGLIRVNADEVTYNLHILIRFELEQMLFNGNLAIADLPEAWNQKYEHYLGIRPSSNAEGVLQDVHWSCGLFGYFPTYTLGNLYSCQLFEKAQKDIPNLNQALETGQLTLLTQWLSQNVFATGRLHSAKELMESITGETLSEQPFLNYLNTKYLN